MGIYFALIAVILGLPIFATVISSNGGNRQKIIAIFGITVVYLLLALKGDVGADIPGYEEQYYISAEKAWDDVDYVYFEDGYITFMKLFSKLGIDFQLYLAVVYLIACLSMFVLIAKYSRNSTLSLIIFVCYQFFVFYISGIRQCIAMSICILSFVLFQKNNLLSKILALVLIGAAISIHQSAIIAVIIPFVSLIKSTKINIFIYLFGVVAAIIIRPYVWMFVNEYFRELDMTTEVTLGGNFIMLCLIGLAMYLINAKNNLLGISTRTNEISREDAIQDAFFTRMILLSVCANIVFSGHAMLRSTMYLTMFIIPGLPNTISKLEYKTRIIITVCFVVFFIILFYTDTLLPNQLELLPYEFFWN